MWFIALPLNVNYEPILIFCLQILLHHKTHHHFTSMCMWCSECAACLLILRKSCTQHDRHALPVHMTLRSGTVIIKSERSRNTNSYWLLLLPTCDRNAIYTVWHVSHEFETVEKVKEHLIRMICAFLQNQQLIWKLKKQELMPLEWTWKQLFSWTVLIFQHHRQPRLRMRCVN